mmetsp:Transcript_95740/g.253037  ORF Transcript_95740/g.253037 Transcript_95740/m.253037 type:complete len:740 (-) Transcript_95740:71-2290(-)
MARLTGAMLLLGLLACGALATELEAREASLEAAWSNVLMPPAAEAKERVNPVKRVVNLLNKMKSELEAEADNEAEMYDKMVCWCETNEKEKTLAIEEAQAKIEELNAFLEEAAANIGSLKTEIASLASDIAEDEDALATATATREKDFAAFQSEETDIKETKALLKEAIDVLSKVQLLQKGRKASGADQARARAALVQVQEHVRSLPRTHYASVMQRDLFDMFGSFGEATRGLRGASFEQSGLLPWEKTEEQIGMEAKPNELKGAAADSKSYNSRSGGILGLLAEMNDQFTEDLSSAQKQDFEAEVSFQNLKAAKLGEIAAATEQKERKQVELADTIDKNAKALEDRDVTQAAMEADQSFLANMLKDCKAQDAAYKARTKVRGDEQVALQETLKILSEDDARDLFGKTEGTAFLQVASQASRAAAEDRAAQKAMQRLASVGKRNKNWALMALAVRVRLDTFTKVIEAMDKMMAEMQRQQKEEYEKSEFCKKEIDKLEDEIKVGVNTKEDLDEKHQQLVNTLDTLAHDLEALKAEEEEMKASLKEAGENRKAENQLFQQSVSDQRATINILNKAMKRLQMFYTPMAGEFMQAPGQAVAPKPPTPKDYSKSAGAGGVLQLLQKIITDADSEEKELEIDEQHSQELYAKFVRVTTDTIEADRAALAEKTGLVAEGAGAKSETEGAQLSNDENLGNLNDLLKAQHLDCDWLLKYFDLRQKARTEEMDAITDAKAVLSGADFGK